MYTSLSYEGIKKRRPSRATEKCDSHCIYLAKLRINKCFLMLQLAYFQTVWHLCRASGIKKIECIIIAVSKSNNEVRYVTLSKCLLLTRD